MPDPVAFEFETAKALLRMLRKSKDGQYESLPTDEIISNKADPFVWVFNYSQVTCTYDEDVKAWLVPGAVSFFPIQAGVNASDEIQFGKTNDDGIVTGGITCTVYIPRPSEESVAPKIAIGYYLGVLYGYDDEDVAQVVLPMPVPSIPDSGLATIQVVSDVWSTPTGLEVSYAQFSGQNYSNTIIKNFLGLSDVAETSYTGKANYVVKVNAQATGLIFGIGGGGGSGATAFTQLSDCPPSFTGAYKSVTINSGNSGLTFNNNNVSTQYSVSGGGNPNNPSYTPIQLVGDTATPTASYYYGTNSGGTRGFFAIPSGTVTTQYSVQGTGSSVSKIQLVGDVETPDPYYYYGTDIAGTKGYADLGAAIADLIAGGITVDGGDF